MAVGLPGKNGVISGMRGSCEIVVEINLIKAVQDIPFFISKNNVVLSPGLGEKGYIPPSYFRNIFELKSGNFLYEAPIDYLCIYDLECNCSKNEGEIAFNEIIEFPVICLDIK